MRIGAAAGAAILLAAMPAWAAQTARSPGTVAIACFLAVVAATLGITWWAARRTRSAHDFYAAGSRIAGWQNGLAIAGDFMSAATFLGITGLFFLVGFDAVVYIICPLVSFSVLLFLMADRLRNLGRFTFADVICVRLARRPMRIFAACAGLSSALMYLVAQVVGAGSLIQVLFGIPYAWAVVLVGVLMVMYVGFGGMLATTWVQITKAVLLMSGVAYLGFAVLAHYGFDYAALFGAATEAHARGALLSRPGGAGYTTAGALSLALGLTFGIVGSPHILMRFFTVPDARAARQSAFVAMMAVIFVFLLIFYVVGVGAVALVTGNPAFLDAEGAIVGGSNMVAVHLAGVVGGEAFLGFISAVAFATILAVVAGLTLASASAVSHDLYANVVRAGREPVDEVAVSRVATVLIGVLAIVLGIVFEGQNIAYLVALALTIAASANFPVLILSMYWRGLTTRGAALGGGIGLASAVLAVLLGPVVWVQILGFERALFPSPYPALTSMALALAACWLFSVRDRSPRAALDRDNFAVQFRRGQAG